jgi:hypothetical protein
MVLVVLGVIVVLLVVILLVLLRLLARGSSSGNGTGTTGTPGGGTYTIPDQIAGSAVSGYLQARLAGTALDGSAPALTPTTVVWVDRGDEVLVHLDSLQTQISGSTVLISLDLETDQTGRTPLVAAFSLGTDGQGGLIAATDEYPRGNGVLAARWGGAFQTAAWSALLSLASDHATERNSAPLGLFVSGGQLQLQAGAALAAV